MQTKSYILVPKPRGLFEQGHYRGCGYLFVSYAVGKLLSVLGAAVCEYLAHNARRVSPYVALPVHEKLIQKAKRSQLAVSRHVCAVLLKQSEISPYFVQILLASGLLEQLGERFILCERMHERYAVFECEVSQRIERFLSGEQCKVPRILLAKFIGVELARYAVAV